MLIPLASYHLSVMRASYISHREAAFYLSSATSISAMPPSRRMACDIWNGPSL